MNDLIKILMSDKGRDANRTLVLLGIIWLGFQVDALKDKAATISTRVAVIESRLLGSSPTNAPAVAALR